MKIQEVAVIHSPREGRAYPEAPFDPPSLFAEFRSLHGAPMKTDPENAVYGQVRDLLAALGLDRENAQTPSWNPFGGMVRKGDHVVIKPNLVFDEHPLGAQGVEGMVTHASIVRPLIDYLLLAAGSEIKITICDVPLQHANWDRLISRSGFKDLTDYYRSLNLDVSLLDLRREISLKNKEGLILRRISRQNDPMGYAVIDLKDRSCLHPIHKDSKKLEITDYGKGTVGRHHDVEKNEYLVCRTVLDADLVINVPKMKTHRKAGVSLAMKNLVGINGDKSWIAHHRRGVDEYPKFDLSAYVKWYVSHYMKLYAPTFLTSLVYKTYRRVCLGGKSIKKHGMLHGGTLMEGNWHGNDTVWRTIVDLNNILFFCDKDGTLRDTPQRKYLAVVDGVVGMESEGPMDGYPKRTDILVGGGHPVAVDWVSSHLMGVDPERIRHIKEGFAERNFGLSPFPPESIEVTGLSGWQGMDLKFKPSRGWQGFMERNVSCERGIN